jgi:hypothetical protein
LLAVFSVLHRKTAVRSQVVLGAPLLPLFGLPIFVVGFPRPRRFWPQPGITAAPSNDSVYYERATPVLSSYLANQFKTGAFGHVGVGDHFLIRYVGVLHV